jgi:hypothetical protein
MLGETEGLRHGLRAEADSCGVERLDALPGNVGYPSSSQLDPQADHLGMGLEPHDEVHEMADCGSLGICNVVAENLREPKHRLPGLHAIARPRAGDADTGIDRDTAGREGEDRVQVELGDRGQVLRQAR